MRTYVPGICLSYAGQEVGKLRLPNFPGCTWREELWGFQKDHEPESQSTGVKCQFRHSLATGAGQSTLPDGEKEKGLSIHEGQNRPRSDPGPPRPGAKGRVFPAATCPSA